MSAARFYLDVGLLLDPARSPCCYSAREVLDVWARYFEKRDGVAASAAYVPAQRSWLIEVLAREPAL